MVVGASWYGNWTVERKADGELVGRVGLCRQSSSSPSRTLAPLTLWWLEGLRPGRVSSSALGARVRVSRAPVVDSEPRRFEIVRSGLVGGL